LWIGINEGEWGIISRTGAPSMPHKLTWTEWQPNDGTVTPFRGYRPEVEKPEIAEFRRGHDDGFLFDFTAYEGRAAGADANKSFPAIGPNWGADYNSVWAISALALGIALLFGARFVRHRAPADIQA
jgi:hypothetical protein